MRTNLNGLETYFKSISTDKVRFDVYQNAQKAGSSIVMVSEFLVSDYELMIDGHKAVVKQLDNLKSSVLESKFFADELKCLKEYEELKNMQFVLDKLKELDLSKIQEVKKDNYINIQKMLGGK